MNDPFPMAVLAHYPGPWVGDAVLTPIAGGFSGTRLWKVTTTGGAAVLRRWPDRFPQRRLSQLHEVLKSLRGRGCGFVPRPILSLSDETWVLAGGSCWDLCDWIRGDPDRESAPTQARLRSAIDALRRTHSALLPTDLEPLQADIASVDKWGAFRRHRPPESPAVSRRVQEWTRLRGVSASPTLDDDPMRLTQRSLELAKRDSPWFERLHGFAGEPVALTICWRDVHRRDVFFLGDEVSGIVDYGAMGIDAPFADIGRLLGSWIPLRPDLWIEVLDAYSDDPSVRRRTAEAAWLSFRTGAVLAALHWIEWLFVERRFFPDVGAAYGRWHEIVETLESLPAHAGFELD